MRDRHGEVWKNTCRLMGLKNVVPASEQDKGRKAFSLETFYRLLMKWVVIDDQV